MRSVVTTTQFRRDVKILKKRGYNMEKLTHILDNLLAGSALPIRYRDHALTGQWRLYRDCHIAPDWLLIYRIDGDNLHLVRTGTHADLFN